MSFCVRSFSNSSRFVPTFVASTQVCAAARRFSSRQLPKHVNSATSSFLNEFLGSNVMPASFLDIRDNKLPNTSNECTSNKYPQFILYCDINQLDNDYFTYNDDVNNEIYTYTENDEPLLHEIIHIPFFNQAKDELKFVDNTKLYGIQNSMLGYEKSWIHLENNKTRLIAGYPITKDENTIFCTKRATAVKEQVIDSVSKKNLNRSEDKKPSNDNLEHVFNTLSLDLPRFFIKSMDYRIYHSDIEFINNIRKKTTKGFKEYYTQLSLLRILGHLKYAFIKLEVLKITMHTHDNSVRVRWRIVGITGMKILFSFWKFKIWKIKETSKETEAWYDGFSTFYVGNDGLVYKHVADKMMPDEDSEEVKTKSIPTKLAQQLTFSSID